MAENKAQAASSVQPQGEINGRSVLLGAAAIVCAVLIAALAAYLLWRSWDSPTADVQGGRAPFDAQPVLQSTPQREREQYFAEKQRLLDSWQWIDETAGIARIPVAQAMEIMAANAEAQRSAAARGRK